MEDKKETKTYEVNKEGSLIIRFHGFEPVFLMTDKNQREVIGEQEYFKTQTIPKAKVEPLMSYIKSQQEYIEGRLKEINAELDGPLSNVELDLIPADLIQAAQEVKEQLAKNAKKAHKEGVKAFQALDGYLMQAQKKRGLMLEKDRLEKAQVEVNRDVDEVERLLKH